MKNEQDYIMQTLLGNIWINRKGVRIRPETADQLNRDSSSTKVRYMPGKWDGVVGEYRPKAASPEKKELSLDEMNVPQLKKYAKDNGIDLGGAKKKVEILAIING